MKNLKTLLLASILFLGTAQTITAQAKMAHVNINDIMEKYPVAIDARKQLEKISLSYQNDYKTITDEYNAKLKKFEAEVKTVSETINVERQKEVQDMERRIQEFGQTAQKEIETKNGDLMRPIGEKVKAAITKVGKAKMYQYVVDAAGLLLADGPDLTADVKKELGF